MRIFSVFRYSEWSLKRKLFGYMLLLAMLLLVALVIGLVLFGRFNSTAKNTYEALDIQLKVFEKDVSTHFDKLAAAGIHLSESTAEFLEDYLAERKLSFDQLNDTNAEITSIQEELIEQLRQKMLQEKFHTEIGKRGTEKDRCQFSCPDQIEIKFSTCPI